MEGLFFKIGIAILGLIAINVLLSRFKKNKTTDTTFMKEYVDILNNPVYKIKKE